MYESYRNELLNCTTNCERPVSPELMAVAEKLAKANHEGWLEGKSAKGYVYGPTTNDDPAAGPLTSPLMVPYEELDDETKASNIANVMAVIRIMDNKGVCFVDFRVILYGMAKEIHDDWCRQKFAAGWICGEATDKPNKVHRDLRPFEDLLNDPELMHDVDYDVDTARKVLVTMICNCDIFPANVMLAAFAT